MAIQSNRLPVRHQINKSLKLFVRRYKRHAIGILLVGLETTSLLLDVFGKTKLVSVVGALVLSVFGFGVTMYSFITERTKTQLGVVDIVFSVLQLITTSIHLVLASIGVKVVYTAASLFPLVFAIIVVLFIFKNHKDYSQATSLSLTDLLSRSEQGNSMDANDWRWRSRMGMGITNSIESYLVQAPPGEFDQLKRLSRKRSI